MEYRRGDLQMALPCKHVYHASCVTRWLSINKVSDKKKEQSISAFRFYTSASLAHKSILHLLCRYVLFALLKFLLRSRR
jgi:hypothetical protein